jgi:hypothetical protein
MINEAAGLTYSLLLPIPRFDVIKPQIIQVKFVGGINWSVLSSKRAYTVTASRIFASWIGIVRGVASIDPETVPLVIIHSCMT